MAIGRANNFNLIRLSLASAVIFSHSPALVDGFQTRREPLQMILGHHITLGTLAVAGFFFLSGYLIAQSWDRTPRLRTYFHKRFCRIFPGFLAAYCFSCLIVGPFLGTNPDYWRGFRVPKFLLGIVFMRAPNFLSAFPTQPWSYVNGSLWTISYEFICYIVLGLLGIAGLLRRRYLMLVVTVGLIGWSLAQSQELVKPIPMDLSIGGKITIPIGGNNEQFPWLISTFLTGTCFSLFRDRLRYSWTLGLIAAGCLIPAMFHPISIVPAVPILGGYLLLALGLAAPLPGTGFVRREDLSYGVYLYAWPIQQVIISHNRSIDPWLLSMIALPIALIFGWLSWHLVESPFLRWRTEKEKPSPGLPSAVAD